MNKQDINRIIDEVIRRRTIWEEDRDRAMKNYDLECVDDMIIRIRAADVIIADLIALREAGL